MSAPAPIANYVVEVPKDDVRRTVHGFSPYSPSPVSPDAVREAIAAKDQDLAAIQLAHYWLKTDRWVRQHNTEVEEAERARREAEDMRKLAEHKKKEIEEDRRRRAEHEEKEKRRKEKGKGKEIAPEAGPSSPRKRKATEELSRTGTKKPKVSVSGLENGTDLYNSSIRKSIVTSPPALRLAGVAFNAGGPASTSLGKKEKQPHAWPAT